MSWIKMGVKVFQLLAPREKKKGSLAGNGIVCFLGLDSPFLFSLFSRSSTWCWYGFRSSLFRGGNEDEEKKEDACLRLGVFGFATVWMLETGTEIEEFLWCLRMSWYLLNQWTRWTRPSFHASFLNANSRIFKQNPTSTTYLLRTFSKKVISRDGYFPPVLISRPNSLPQFLTFPFISSSPFQSAHISPRERNSPSHDASARQWKVSQ